MVQILSTQDPATNFFKHSLWFRARGIITSKIKAMALRNFNSSRGIPEGKAAPLCVSAVARMSNLLLKQAVALIQQAQVATIFVAIQQSPAGR
jgi:hypothetical protein